MAKERKEYKNSGYINLSWNSNEQCWNVGGNYTDKDGKKWDLGYHKVPGSLQLLTEAIASCASAMGPTLAGKGMPRKEQEKDESGPGPDSGYR